MSKYNIETSDLFSSFFVTRGIKRVRERGVLGLALCIAQIPARQRVGGGFVRTPGVLTGTRDRLVVPPIIDWHARALSLNGTAPE